MARLFTVASDDTLISMISAARDRLVVVAPGLSRAVAAALADRIKGDGGPPEISVTLDVDSEVCRLGYGDIEAFDLLRPALESRRRRLQTQKGVRIGLLVADSDVLVYSPTPLLIEAGSNSEEKPNAIRVTGIGPRELALACGANDAQVLGLGPEVGLSVASEEVVRETKADLEENPPRKFDLVRLERIFNYKLEYVEFSIANFRLNTRSVPLPAELLGLGEENLEDRLRNTFRVFESGTPFEFEIPDPVDPSRNVKVTEKWLSQQAAKLRKEYFIPLGSNSYGNLILKRQKAEFQRRVERLTSFVNSYAEMARNGIGNKIRATRDELINTLFPRVKAAPPPSWLQRSVDGKLKEDVLRKRLEEEVDRAFEEVEESFNPTVACVFKGVNYETIMSDKHFRERIESHFGHEEAAKLLLEHDASRAQDVVHQ